MTVLASILVIASSVIGGDVGPFIAADTNNVGEATERVTPGSVEFYGDEISEIDVYDKGIVYRNGTVVTNVPFPSVVAYAGDDGDYGWGYDISGCRLEPAERFHSYSRTRLPIRMHQFDLDWLTYTNIPTGGPSTPVIDPGSSSGEPREDLFYYYAYGTNHVKKTVSPGIILPSSRRFDQDTKAALLATAEAYYERLYWGSKGDVNDWDTTEFGRTTPGPGFKFNFDAHGHAYVSTNHFEYAYPTNDMRLLEYPNFVRQLEAMAKMFPSYACGSYSSQYTISDHPAWLFRPGWLLDMWGYIEEQRNHLWWSSSKMPVPGDDFEDYCGYVPTDDDFTLLPATEWAPTNVIDSTNAHWECKAFVLDSVANGVGGFQGQSDDTLYPVPQLLRELFWTMTGEAWQFDVAHWPSHEQNALQRYLLSIFDHAAHESVNPTNAFDRYCHRYFETADSRRLTPTAYAGLNHLLAAMNATVMVPWFSLGALHQQYYAESGARYESPDGCEARWDGDVLVVDFGAGKHSVSMSSHSNVTAAVSGDQAEHFIRLDVDHLRLADMDLPKTQVTKLERVYLGEDFPQYVSEREPRPIVITQFAVAPNGNLLFYYRVVNGERLEPGEYEMEFPAELLTVAKSGDPSGVDVSTKINLTRSYRFYAPTGEFNPSTREEDYGPENLQPPTDAGDRVKKSVYANAWMRSVNGSEELKFTSDAEYTRAGFSRIMAGHGSDAIADLDEAAMDFYGVDYRHPEEFAPLPNAIRYSVTGGELRYEEVSRELTGLIDYPETYNYEKMRTRGYFLVTNLTWSATNACSTVSNETVVSEVAATVRTVVAPDGWQWVDEAWTNTVSSEIADASVVTNLTYDFGVSDIEETIVEREKWPEEPGYAEPIDMVEWTNVYESATNVLVRDTACSGFQTNIVVYYDIHLAVTNATTNVTEIAYDRHEEIDLGDSYVRFVEQVERQWKEYLGDRRPSMEYEFPYAFQVDRLLYLSGSSASWVIIDPINGRIVPIDSAEFPLLIGTVTITCEPLAEDLEKFKIDTSDWPEMPTAEFHAKEGFRPITKTIWNWKSMKLKGE